MSLNRIALFFATMSGLALTACNPDGSGSVAPSAPVAENGQVDRPIAIPPGFAADYQALKARERDPVKLEAGMNELLARYGLRSPLLPPAPSLPGTIDFPDAQGLPASGSLGKAAATSWYAVKYANFALDFVAFKTFYIPAGGRLTVTNDHDPATSILDPFAVAFYKPDTTTDANKTEVIFAGIDDDAGGNGNSLISWVNNTGATRLVTVIGSAFMPNAAGMGTLKLVCKTSGGASCGTYTKTTYMSGVTIRSNQAVNAPGCTGPNRSKISLAINAGGDHGPGVLAVNAVTMKGGFIYTKAGSLVLDDVQTTTHPNFVMGFSSGIGGFDCTPFGQPPRTCYETPNSYSFAQVDSYTCP